MCVYISVRGGLWTKSRTLFIIHTHTVSGLSSRSRFSRGSTKNRYRSITTLCEIHIMLLWWYYILLLLLQLGVHCPWRLNSANYNTVRAADWNVLQENIIMEFRTGYNIILYAASVLPRTRSVLCSRKSVFIFIYHYFFHSCRRRTRICFFIFWYGPRPRHLPWIPRIGIPCSNRWRTHPYTPLRDDRLVKNDSN